MCTFLIYASLLLDYLLIPSCFVPLRATLLIFSYLGNTWESLGPQVTSFVSLLPLPSLYPLCNLRSYPHLFLFPRVLLCAAPLPITREAPPQPLLFPFALTRSLNLTPVTRVASLYGTTILAVTTFLKSVCHCYYLELYYITMADNLPIHASRAEFQLSPKFGA